MDGVLLGCKDIDGRRSDECFSVADNHEADAARATTFLLEVAMVVRIPIIIVPVRLARVGFRMDFLFIVFYFFAGFASLRPNFAVSSLLYHILSQ